MGEDTITVSLQGRTIEIDKNRVESGLAEGEEVSLSIKPEAIDVSTEKTGFYGRLDVSSFLGSITELKVEFDGTFLTIIHSNTHGIIHGMKMDDEVNIAFNNKFFRIYRK